MARTSKPAPVPLPLTTTFQLVAAGRVAQQRLERELEPHGLTLRHVGALGHLANRPELSYSDLARRAGVTAQSMHATVRQLEELGAVRRDLAGHGHRARLEVTAAGRELLTVAAKAAQRVDAELLAAVPAASRTAIAAFLAGLAMPPVRPPDA
jgi:DNA-binding MarR family transcriptional regulator